MDKLDFSPWQWMLTAGVAAGALFASGHALIHKRDPRSSLWWVSLNLFLPLFGPILYCFFGINRIERKAARLRLKKRLHGSEKDLLEQNLKKPIFPVNIEHLERLSRTLSGVLQTPLIPGNKVTPLVDGDQAYPEMLEAIEKARQSIGLSVYIFNNDDTGQQFIKALADAVQRGVQVRVLVDDVGIGFFTKSIVPRLKKASIPTAVFLPTLLPPKTAHINLRNHRKILTIDGRIAFTGGMNIADEHRMGAKRKNYCKDIHFRLEGPAVGQIQEVFRLDWHFASDEDLNDAAWFPKLEEKGVVEARAIPDGPDENIRKTRWAIIGALAHARKSVQIMTPYFIPDAGLITALQVAVLNGVNVDIFLPRMSDWRIVHWASRAMAWQILEIGCRIYEMPPPFHHSKLMVVDGGWVLFGSSNWDARSFRLNFEFNMECYDLDLAKSIQDYFERHRANARELTLRDIDKRPLLSKLRDGFARLFSPIL